MIPLDPTRTLSALQRHRIPYDGLEGTCDSKGRNNDERVHAQGRVSTGSASLAI